MTDQHPTAADPPMTGVPDEAEAHAVLQRAGRTGYVMVGARDRVCRYDHPNAHAVAVDVTPQERDTVHALIAAGLLALGARLPVQDGPHQRTGYDLYLTRAGRHAFRTTRSST